MKANWEDSQLWLWGLAIALLAVGSAAGALWPQHFSGMLAPSIKQLREFAQQTNAFQNPFHTSVVIFVHNSEAAIGVMILSGIFTAGIYPAWALWLNGLAMGYVVATGSHQLGTTDWRVFVFGMLPHGVFELTAFVWSGVLGIHLGYAVVRALWRWLTVRGATTEATQLRPTSPAQVSLGMEFRRVLVRIPYIIGLLMLAAAVEGTITPYLIERGVLHHIG